jgi:hypothetical protein
MVKGDGLTKEEFREKELAILRDAVNMVEEGQAREAAGAPAVKKIIAIVEEFLRKKKLICYGGAAINNILPKEDQFYDKELEIPDYDFFSPDALTDAKQLADIYAKKGYEEVEAKAGQHFGTFKVFVDHIPVADITQIDPELFKRLKKDAMIVSGIYYSPVDLLRMNMYLELSRPAGMVGRWEKVLKRLILLNKHYPLRGAKCDPDTFQRSFESGAAQDEKDIYSITRSTFAKEGLVFFGGYANSLYMKYMPHQAREAHAMLPDFDVLSTDPEKSAKSVVSALEKKGVKGAKAISREGLGELLAEHFEIRVGHDTIAFIYKPLACHSYNTVDVRGTKLKIATIDTMLNLYLSFLFADRDYYDSERIMCMAEYLFKVQATNRLAQKGVLRRFSTECYGDQETLADMRKEKAKAFKKFGTARGTKEYEEHFLRYVPGEEKKKSSAKTRKHSSPRKSSSSKTKSARKR